MRKDFLFLFIIIIVSFALRFYGAMIIPLTDDEYNDFKSVEDLSFSLKHHRFPLIDRRNGGLMGGRYLVYAGWAVFGKSALGARLPFIVTGVFTILIVYLFTKPILGSGAAFLASILLSISQWHVGITRIANMAPFEFLAVLSLFLFYKGVVMGKNKLILLSGAAVGIGFFLEEHIILLIPIYLIFLYFSEYRYWLRKKIIWVSFGIIALIMSPLSFLLLKPDNPRLEYIHHAVCAGPSLNAIGLYVGELIFLLIKPFPHLFNYAVEATENEYPMANFVFGLLVLSAVIKYLRSKNSFVRLLVVWFLVNFAVFSVFRCCNDANTIWSLGSLEWSCLTFVPGVILCAHMISGFVRNNNAYHRKIMTAVMLVFMLYRTIDTISYPLNCYFPARVCQLNMQFGDIKDLLNEGDNQTAKDRLIRIYKVSRRIPEIRKEAALMLANIFVQEKKYNKSKIYLDYVLSQDPGNSAALEMLKKLSN